MTTKETRDKLAEKHASRNNISWADREIANCLSDYKAGFDAGLAHATEQADRLAEALEFWAKESEWMTVPVEFQVERARKKLAEYAAWKAGNK